MTAARRLAAILVAYSRLMGEDEAGTALTVREHREAARPIVAGLGGRIVKTMGDGLLLEFPSVVAAVECAIAVQKLMVERNAETPDDKRIVYRMGINLGDVLIEGEDILGEGVNIAARLEGICEPGGMLVSGTAFDHVRGKLDANFVDLGEQELKNITRPVRAYRVVMDQDAAKPEPSDPEKRTASLALPGKPSIAVLPFQNMSGDPDQEYFADGMVEDITTGLSRIKWLFVIARNSGFTYKGKAVDVRQVGRELGVRYLLEGGVRKSGNRLRITAQLIEAETGAHLWADKFDGPLDEVFDLQDRITDLVVGVVEPRLQRSEVEWSGRKRPQNLDAYDMYLRALPRARNSTPSEAKAAIGFLEGALKLAPNYAGAHALASLCHRTCYLYDGFDEAEKRAALWHARAVVGSGTDDAFALAATAIVLVLMSTELDAALSAIERALAVNPSSAAAHYCGGLIHAFRGNSSVADAHADSALRLSPFDSMDIAYDAHGIAAVQRNSLR